MVDNDGRVVLIDFGVSKQYDEVNGENTSTLLGSTPGYAPIEQSGSGVSEFYPSTDIYSLGATLYKLLTGNTPLPAHQLASGETLPPLPHSVSAATRKAVECAMSLNRNNRPQNIGEFLSLLECHSEQKPVISTEHSGGEISNTDDGATVVADDDNSHSSEDDKKRPDDNSPKRSFSNGTILILSVAAVLLFVALFFVKSCNDRKTAEAEAQHATEIADRKANGTQLGEENDRSRQWGNLWN
jgi:serine/threonine protein kinase